MPIPALTSTLLPEATVTPLEREPRRTDAEKLTEVARQFEAILVRQILTDAQKKLCAGGTEPESAAGSIYQDMITNNLAERISQAGTLGLARTLEKQLHREITTVPAAAPGPAHV